jgi:chromate transporter
MSSAERRAAGDTDAPTTAPAPPSFGEAFRTWLKIGVISFGGPAAQIALMHRIVVDEKRWVDEARFLHALNYCMLLPGPEAQQLAVYLGWLLHRTAGGLVAGILFVLPGALVMLTLSVLCVLAAHMPVVTGVFWGIKAAVLAVVVEAILRIGGRALRNTTMYTVAALAFIGIFLFNVPFPLIVLAAGAIGYFGARWHPAMFPATSNGEDTGAKVETHNLAPRGRAARSEARRLSETIGIGLVLWFAPTVAFAWLLGWSSGFTDIGVFFSKMAVVTFGGAYAVLSYVAQQAVDTYGWLSPGDMLTGLGLAETTPGPLIMVVQFVAFLGAYRDPGPFDPLTAGVVGGLLATWVTFVPCFMWIFLGAPYVERLRGNRRLSVALATITAAVVGVILNLAVWFALHVVFAHVGESWFGPARLFVPDVASLDPGALALAASAMVAMLRFRLGVLPTLAIAALVGILMNA